MDEDISAEELRGLLDGDADADVRVVDIRSPSAFRGGHVPGSVNVPFGELTDRIDDVADADRVVTVCPRGEASVQAARLVRAYDGFDGRAASLACGIDEWPYALETAADDAASPAAGAGSSDSGRGGSGDGDGSPDGGPRDSADGARGEPGHGGHEEPADARTADEGPEAPF
jgi:rhodanese-related sulfurtransferase